MAKRHDDAAPRADPLVRELAHARTYQHAAEADARANEAELRDVAAFRERLLGALGHDLRNPLNKILMAAGVLAGGDHLTHGQAQLAARIIDSGQRMNHMIAQILELTRVHLGGGFELEKLPVDVSPICERIAAELRLGAMANIDVVTRGDTSGCWDPNRLSEAISSVVGNAVEHAAPLTAVLVDVRRERDEVVVAVTNHGDAIAPALLPVIFEPLRNGMNPMRQRGHLGLGLFIAREVARAHSGKLEATSSEGRTTFTIRLPRANCARS